MATLPAVRSPADLALPPLEEWHTAVANSLTDAGAARFADELVEALWAAKKSGDLRPVQQVVEGWYGTLAFLGANAGQPDAFEQLVELSASEEPLTFSEVKAKLGI